MTKSDIATSQEKTGIEIIDSQNKTLAPDMLRSFDFLPSVLTKTEYCAIIVLRQLNEALTTNELVSETQGIEHEMLEEPSNYRTVVKVLHSLETAGLLVSRKKTGNRKILLWSLNPKFLSLWWDRRAAFMADIKRKDVDASSKYPPLTWEWYDVGNALSLKLHRRRIKESKDFEELHKLKKKK